MGGGAPCDGDVDVVGEQRRGGHRLVWRGLGRRRKLPVVRLGGGGGGGRRRRGFLRRLRLRWLAARWLRRAVRRLAAIYVAALAGPPPHAPPSSSPSCRRPWIGAEPLFAVPFMPNVRPFL
ncbi:hypothetical protein OsI_07704 [Oryza sativa Indica Group]|uniref:Uncharacterized protein n=2 Tax=Oryza TaxID=4527 RepID=A2X669_ORYSI|nr:uncharacterized protein LOC127763994 [Oryza glaberrima]EAY86329.1 hypothetical protein OsI_07704 [Oryza sativa Indica Group]